jgi:hypothetical protein
MTRVIWVGVFGLLLFSAYLVVRPPPGRFDWAEFTVSVPQFISGVADLAMFLIALSIGALLVIGIIAVPYQIGRWTGRRGARLPAVSDRERAGAWLILTGSFVFWVFYGFGVLPKGGPFHWLSFLGTGWRQRVRHFDLGGELHFECVGLSFTRGDL